MKEAGDVSRSKETVETYKENLAELEEAFRQESEALAAQYDAANIELVPLNIRPTKQDIQVRALVLVWMPYRETQDGSQEPAWV